MIFLGVILGTCALFIGFLMYIVCRKQSPFLRSVGLFLFAVCLAIIYGFSTEILSYPKPVEMEFLHRSSENAEILAFSLKEGEGIYLWLELPNVSIPRYYSLPWDMETAQRLKSKAGETGPGDILTFIDPFKGNETIESESPFQNRPQEPYPPKIVH
tara:strand:- start:244 stop:714 length:471 start_codon:yes stop_codon:yes gene_type:complete